MTENAYIATDELLDRATWAVNSLLEAGEDALAEDLATSYEEELKRAS